MYKLLFINAYTYLYICTYIHTYIQFHAANRSFMSDSVKLNFFKLLFTIMRHLPPTVYQATLKTLGVCSDVSVTAEIYTSYLIFKYFNVAL